MKILYFAWLREKTGLGSEDATLPKNVKDVNALIHWLKGRSEGHAEAFSDLTHIRAAVNQEHVGLDHPVADGDEVAFFPPVTGG